MIDTPTVRRLVLFRHGVAYVERSGAAEGAFELSFKQGEMNDVLKSLSVWVAAGDARVGSVAFESPVDPARALAERNLDLPAGEALTGMLTALRGRRVAVDDGPPGEIVGLERTPGGDGPPRRQLVLRDDEGGVRLVDLAAVQRVSLVEAPSRADLAFLVDRVRAASSGATRSVRVDLRGRADELRIAYVIPAPIWRVSYRLAIGEEETVLMAWGIVHNPVDEDLDDVELTLTTGQPVSFVIDLYAAKHVERTVVEEQSRAAAAPVAYAAAMPLGGAPPAAAPGAPPPLRTRAAPMPQTLAESFASQASGAERGELFEYRIDAPVAMKRGGSAMVPLAMAKLSAEKERIWRAGGSPNPDIVVAFDNTSGVVLEEGPAVVYDDGGYAGEAMVPYSVRGAGVKLAFAKDLAIRCRRTSESHHDIAGLRLGDDAIVQELRAGERHHLRIESDHDEPVVVIVELPRHPGRSFAADGPKPFAATDRHHRFRFEVTGTFEVTVHEEWRTQQHVSFNHLSAALLKSWLTQRFLDDAALALLADVLEAWQKADELEAERQTHEQARQALFEKQAKLSEQLGVLRDSGEEGRLRLRYVNELAAAQDQVNATEETIRRVERDARTLRARARSLLRDVTR